MDNRSGTLNKRPLTVTILAIVVLTIPVMNLIRLWAVIRYWETLTKMGMRPGPLYIAMTGLFWSIAGMGLFWSLWTGRSYSKIAALILVPSYMIYYWVDRLAFQNYVPRENVPFSLAATILVVFYTLFTLLLPANQHYFSRKHEQ